MNEERLFALWYKRDNQYPELDALELLQMEYEDMYPIDKVTTICPKIGH